MPSERELYGLQYIGGYVILQLASYTKILGIPKAKSTTNQFILSEEASKVATYECQNQKTNSELSRGGL